MAHQHHTTDKVFSRALSGLTRQELIALSVMHLHRVFFPADRDSAERHLGMIIGEFKRRRESIQKKVSRSDRASREAGRLLPSGWTLETSPDE